MLFREEHIRMILSGLKTMTRRTSNRVHKLGRIRIQRSWYDWTDIEIDILKRYPQKLGEISLDDVWKEGYNSLEEFKAAWIKIHGRWEPDLDVWVYEFRLV